MIVLFIAIFLTVYVASTIGILVISWALRLMCFAVQVICYVLIALIAVINWLTPQRRAVPVIESPPPGIIDLHWNRQSRRWE